jgi:hypothetical protein
MGWHQLAGWHHGVASWGGINSRGGIMGWHHGVASTGIMGWHQLRIWHQLRMASWGGIMGWHHGVASTGQFLTDLAVATCCWRPQQHSLRCSFERHGDSSLAQCGLPGCIYMAGQSWAKLPCSADLAPALAGDGRAICWQRALVWAMGSPLHRFLGASSRRLCLPLAGARWPICPQQCEGAQAWRLQGA